MGDLEPGARGVLYDSNGTVSEVTASEVVARGWLDYRTLASKYEGYSYFSELFSAFTSGVSRAVYLPLSTPIISYLLAVAMEFLLECGQNGYTTCKPEAAVFVVDRVMYMLWKES